MTPTPIDFKLHGELAEDVVFLRSRGLLVARFRDGYRIGREFATADELISRANVLRARKAAVVKAAPPPAEKPGPQDPVTRAEFTALAARIDLLIGAVARAIGGRKQSLVLQIDGLATIETELST